MKRKDQTKKPQGQDVKITYNKTYSERAIMYCDVTINGSFDISRILLCPYRNNILERLKHKFKGKIKTVDIKILKETGKANK